MPTANQLTTALSSCFTRYRDALLGRPEPTLADARYRFCSIPGFPYLLVYRSDTVPPSVLRFVHTARDLPAVLASLRGPQAP